jgi:hypothetical protein
MPVMAMFFASILTGRGGAESHEKRKYHDVLAQTKENAYRFTDQGSF